MRNISLVLLIICVSTTIFPGISATALAGNESDANAMAEQHFVKANELRKVSNHDGAIVEYEKVISLSPESKVAQNAQYWIGQSHFQAGRLDASLAAFQTLLSEQPSGPIVASTKQMIERVEQSKKEKTLVEAIKNGNLEQLKSLISSGVDVNAKVKATVATYDGNATYVEDGWPLLNLAIRHRHADVATFLIDKGADVNKRGSEHNNRKAPLHWVAHRGTASLARLLIANGADVNIREDGGYTPLYNVSSNNNPDRNDQLEVARLLISNGADIEALTEGHVTPLLNAARNGRVDMVELFLSKGAGIETRDRHGFTPLLAAAQAGSTEIVKMLLDKGADVNCMNNYDTAALHYAVMQGNQDMVKLFLDHGTPLRRHLGINLVGLAMKENQKEMIRFLIDKGFAHSAGHMAAFYGDLDKVKSYLAAGGDIDSIRPMGLSLLGCAMLGGQTDVVEFLVSKNADINMKDAEGWTALRRAVYVERPEIFKILLDKGGDWTIGADRGPMTPLGAAVDAARKDLVEMMLAKGANVNSGGRERPPWFTGNDAQGGGLLFIACQSLNRWWRGDQKAKEEMVKFLVEKGADVNVKTPMGITPLSLLKKGGHKELVEFLREHGAKE